MLNAPSVNTFGARDQYLRGGSQPWQPQADTSWADGARAAYAAREGREQSFNSELGALHRQGASSLGDVLTGTTSAMANVGSNVFTGLSNNASTMAEYKLGKDKVKAALAASDKASARALIGTGLSALATGGALIATGGLAAPAAAAGGGIRYAGDALGGLGFKLAGQGISLG